MRFLLATLLLTMLPGLCLAQSSAAPAPALIEPQSQPLTEWWHGAQDAGTNVRLGAEMPLWTTPDGRILAIVALANTHGAPVLPQSPQIGTAADWRLVDVTNFVSGGLSFKLSNNAHAYANFGRGILLAPLYTTPECGQSSLFGTPAVACVADSFGTGNANLGVELEGGDVALDLNYGLSWLHSSERPAPRQPWDLFGADLGTPTLMLPGFSMANVQNAGFGVQGRWRVDDTQSLDVGAALSRIQFELPGMPLASNLNQAALSLGLHRGDFSGIIVGRVLGPADALGNGQRWSSIDLGISWRAPWRGVFSVGAQNVWSSGYLPSLTEPAPREVDPSQARVPYVQYHQDL